MCLRSARRIQDGTACSTRMDLWRKPAAASCLIGWLQRRCWSVAHTFPGRVSAGSPRTVAAMRLKFSQRNRVGPDRRATLHDFLGVDPGADAQTLKQAFRKMVKEQHPDLHHDPAASQRTKVHTAAHDPADDPKRAVYNQYLAQLHE